MVYAFTEFCSVSCNIWSNITETSSYIQQTDLITNARNYSVFTLCFYRLSFVDVVKRVY